MKRYFLLLFTAAFLFTGCFAAKAPEAVEQITDGGYKGTIDDKHTSVIIVGAYNNLEFGEIKKFREIFEWVDQSGNTYTMDFADEGSPMYIQGRGDIVYIAIRVMPGKYSLRSFMIRSYDKDSYTLLNFKNRYRANFEIADEEVMFIGILRTHYDKYKSENLSPGGTAKIKVNSYLENGKDDLYKITNFYDAITKSKVKTNIMYWNDTNPEQIETVIMTKNN